MTKENRRWPDYLLGGRIRTSTIVLIVVFAMLYWAYQEYKPPQQPVQAPATEVVPPGFVPDPNFTWVPRTDVNQPRRSSTTTTTPTTTETTSPTSPTSPTSTSPTDTATSSTTTTPAPPGAPPSPQSAAGPGPGPSPSPSR